MTTSDKRCSVLIFGGGRSFRGSLCAKPGKVERDGKWYCGVHNPALREARDKTWRARYDAEVAQGNALNEVHGFERQLLALCEQAFDAGKLDRAEHVNVYEAVQRLRKARAAWEAARSARMALPSR